MQIAFSVKNIFFIMLLLLMGTQAVLAKKMFRWVDDAGNVRYSDQVPPDQVKHRREALNENARVVDVVEKQKTKAQRDLEKRLVLLRRQQNEIIRKQKGHDKVLRSTFRNVSDMEMALKGKMLAMDGQRKVVQGNLQRIEKQLQQQQKKAAQFERDGRKVPAKILVDIRLTKEQIELSYIEISKQFEKKKRVREEFEADINRFIYLTQSESEGSKDISRKTAEKKAEKQLGLFVCKSLEQCDKAWVSAKQFVYANSSTALDIETNRLIMSQAPYKDTDLSLSISKMNMDGNKQQLFLDIRCRQSSIGDELCRSAKAKNIRNSFSSYIKLALDVE